MEISYGFKILSIRENGNMYCIKLQRELYSIKQSGKMWHNQLKKNFLKKEYINNETYLYVFIKKSLNDFCIISIYDINIVGTCKKIAGVSSCLKTKF